MNIPKLIYHTISNNKAYLLGGICGIILAFLSCCICMFLIESVFKTKYITTLTIMETVFAGFALIGISTTLYLIVLLIIKLLEIIKGK
jgi:hypothetical protein